MGVVAYELEGHPTGVGRYLEGVLGGVLETDDDREWRLYLHGEPFDHPLFGARGPGGAEIVPVFDHRPKARPIPWEQLRLPALLRRDEIDFVFSPGYSLPPHVRVPSMVTLHDLSFEHLRREFPWREGLRRRWLARLAARKAYRVLVDTETVAADLERTYGLDPSRIGVVPLAVDHQFFAVDRARPSPEWKALRLDEPYLLYLGTLLPRRRIDLLIQAFATIASERPDLALVIAGADRLPEAGSLEKWIVGSGVAGRIRRLPYVPEAALPHLYARAELSLYLSSYEGYGLPPLESLAAGTPAIATTGMALDDLWPHYPLRTKPNLDAVTATLRRALDHGPHPELIERARRILGQLTWKSCAERFLEQLELAAG
ncbi:MAG: glycosyltransferase family 4 protein [Holophagales bacterium]|nr:glycosyltransferase family 4 protein [Holophagales bacterium]